jgi:hypothetical protein
MYFSLKNIVKIICMHFYNFILHKFWDAKNFYILRDPCASKVLRKVIRRSYKK